MLYIKQGNEREYPIYNIGDGIQQLIIITFPLFVYGDKDLLLFIDEPELCLHPGLQRQLIEILTMSQFGNCQVFLSTHSNHFLDLTLDIGNISAYRFRKILESSELRETEAKFVIENASSDDGNLLACIGVKSSSVFLAKCTIWVEGITDRLYLRKFLDIYQKHNKDKDSNFQVFTEDAHFAFVEYGGSNITHWSFLEEEKKPMNVARICSSLFLIADRGSDISGALSKRHKELSEKLPDRYYRLKSPEIENLLSPKIITGVVMRILGKAIQITPFAQSDYKELPLGNFIDGKIDKKSTSKTFAGNYGRIRDKKQFCQKTIEFIGSIEDLSPEAIEISDKIYNFIKQQNTAIGDKK